MHIGTTIFGSFQNSKSESVSASVVDVNEKLKGTIQKIANNVSLLYRLLNTIRKASKEAQNLKAAKSFRIEDDEKNDLEPMLRELFAHNIRDRFPGINEITLERLVSTMLLRRKRILYRRSRYGNAHIKLQDSTPKPKIKAPQSQQQIIVDPEPAPVSEKSQPTVQIAPTIVQSVAPSATTLAADKFKMASTPSVVSASKTVALGNNQDLVFPPAPKSRIRLKYERLEEKRRREHATRVQALLRSPESPLPKTRVTKDAEAELQETLKRDRQRREAEMLEVFCPFCLHALSSEDVLDEKKWQ